MITLLAVILACSNTAEETQTADAKVETTEQVETIVETPASTAVNAEKTSENLDNLKKDLDDTIKTLDEVKVLVKDLDKKPDENTKTTNNQNNGDDNASND